VAEVLVGVTEEQGVVAVVVQWSNDQDPCNNLSPTGIACILEAGHDRDWHIGFRDGIVGMPVKWRVHPFRV
jgi:hypothetical protein